MPPLDHSLESRRAYERAPSRWPTEGLQISSFRAIAHKGMQSVGSLRRLGGRKKQNRPTDPDGKDEPAPAARRALTWNLADGNPEASQNGELQSQSPLFRLPLELRQTIYENVMGNSNIHIVSRKAGRLLRHTRCKCVSCPGSAFVFEHGTSWKREWTCDGSKYDIDGDRVPVEILRTCRRIYSEAIDCLYSSNTFSFKDPSVLRKFVAELLPQRKAHLRAVHLDLDSLPPQGGALPQLGRQPSVEELCTNIHGSLSGFPQLRYLELRIHSSSGTHLLIRRDSLALLQRLGQRDNLRRVRLYLSDMSLRADWMNQPPFEVVSMDDWEWRRSRGATMVVF